MCLGLVVSLQTQRIYIDFGVGFSMCLFIRSVTSSRHVKLSTVHMKLVAHLIRARVFDRNVEHTIRLLLPSPALCCSANT